MKKITILPESCGFLERKSSVDVVLVGAGIMSITFGMFLTYLEPTWSIHIYERLDGSAQESTNIWNNAGTGHAAFCELNYTPYGKDGVVNIEKAIAINEAFEMSLQFWAFLVENEVIHYPGSFINNVPHMSFVWNKENVDFLKRRFQALQNNILFSGMMYSEDLEQIYKWAPLIMNGRSMSQKVAATFMQIGTDINFGELTKQMFSALKNNINCSVYLQHDVISLHCNSDATWRVHILDKRCRQKKDICASYVFIGAGGRALNLLQTSRIPEIFKYAGFPVGGKFLVTKNPAIVSQHFAKVYGQASMHAPPMSVPHMDTRILNGKKFLLFGPFATFSSKFLKSGSWLDLFNSLNRHNLFSILQVGIDNFELIKYLINQLVMSDKKRIAKLKEYYPKANSSDWILVTAGQRVQIIKTNDDSDEKRGVLQFGTEVVSSHNGTLSGLLGASPGASTVVAIVLEILQKMFRGKMDSIAWKEKLMDMIPTYKCKLSHDIVLVNKIRRYTCDRLGLKYLEAVSHKKCS
ncbi:malate dehydrogenase (quinone) [Candidatus Blochmannia ocreatus (nom. nud.)]|uniref:Probable malate:quinone oxidoreductase n=1 Tax=Candidatus Blochmannia ocreatus (nom. nud.) TaxID=251538 RepID=A0ABY4SSQ7_9ENTR|nr:malate dehydrogenase (quinone) [Candidatus Blochmannia ocreatus]URJ25010.1 malate dehydrogenase (quinone) [Candidatus Blochmannia ocreatus]